MYSERYRKQHRENMLAEITARWPQGMRDKLHSGQGEERVYPIWYKTLMTGEFDHLPQFTDSNRAAVDVGALLGQYSLTLSALCSRCLCVEPLENYAFLSRVLPGNCIVCTIAAGERPGEGILRTPDYQYGLSSLVDNEWLAAAETVTEQRTAIETLDAIVARRMPDKPIGFCKIDVEDYEREVLRGAEGVLHEHAPNLQIEIDPRHLAQVAAWLDERGYRGMFFYEGRLLDVGRFRPEIHCSPEHEWSIETADRFDPDLYVSNFFFVPYKRESA
jgi:FkbM family methyltransferase